MAPNLANIDQKPRGGRNGVAIALQFDNLERKGGGSLRFPQSSGGKKKGKAIPCGRNKHGGEKKSAKNSGNKGFVVVHGEEKNLFNKKR